MTQEKAKILVRIIFFFAISIIVCLFAVVIVQTVQHNNLEGQISNIQYETDEKIKDGEGLEEKLDYYLKDKENSKEEIKDEIKDEWLLKDGWVEKGSDTEIFA